MTKTGTRTQSSRGARLSEVARRVVQPAAIVSTGWPSIEVTCRKLGTEFDEWQAGIGRLMFAKTKDGKYAATVGGVGMSLPRQVGKTHLVGYAMFALCILHPNLTVIWTAHHTRTANETLRAMQGMAQRQKVAPYVLRILTSNEQKGVEFHNGSRILFGARSDGFGRGFAGVDVLVIDEAQILRERDLDAMLPTLNASEAEAGGLAIYMGTPPTPSDPSEAFRRMRDDALSGEADDLVWVECGADPTADPDDRGQWAKANPSYPKRTPLTSMQRMRKKLSPESWMREGLGIWDEDGADVFAGSWPKCLTDVAPDVTPISLGVACSVELSHSAIVAAAVENDEVHVRVLQYGPGTTWVAAAAKEWSEEFGGAGVAVDGGGPAKVLVQPLELAVKRLRVANLPDYADACAGLFLNVQETRVKHRGDPELDDAVNGAVKRTVGDRWVWGRRKSARDVSALEAATLAAWDAQQPVESAGVFMPSRSRPLLVAGSLAEEYVSSHPEAEGAHVWPDAKPWERDRYRRQNDAEVIVAAASEDEYVPSKYGKERLVVLAAAGKG